MCLIVHRTVNKNGRGRKLPSKIIDHNRKSNPDGFGIAWRSPEKGVVSQKFAPSEFDEFRALLETIDAQRSIEYIAHFRTATHGAKCKDLAHPFIYEDPAGESVAVFHNGIIDIKAYEGESDTSQFVKSVLARLPANWWDNSALIYLVEQAIGWSRLAIMTDNETIRLNQKAWERIDGIWYSTAPIPKVYAPAKVYNGYNGKVTAPYTKTPDSLPTGIVTPTFRTLADATSGVASEGGLVPFPNDGDEEDEADEEGIGMGIDPDLPDIALPNPTGWLHNGHTVSPVSTESGDNEDDKYGNCICEVCNTTGDFYRIEGQIYIDLAHWESTDAGVVIPAANKEPLLLESGAVPRMN